MILTNNSYLKQNGESADQWTWIVIKQDKISDLIEE